MGTSTADAYLSSMGGTSRDELQALQLQRLKITLQHAYENVTHYHQTFDRKGLHPNDLNHLDDIRYFPFLEKADLRANYPFDLFAVPMDKVVRLHASSGATGQPVVAAYTKNDISIWTELMARSIRVAGRTKQDIIQVAYGYGLFTGGLGAHYGGEKIGACVIPISGGNTERQIQTLLDFQATIYMSTPSYALVVAEALAQKGVAPEKNPLRIGLFGAETWTHGMRDGLESMLGIDALNIYGLTEVIGPGVASESIATKDGPIIWEDHFYAEIIDPITNEILPDGCSGELVLTSLTKEALPVIRFKTRDIASILPPTTCSFRRLGPITGRLDDLLIIRGVKLFPTQIETLILSDGALSGHYQIVVDREGPLETLLVSCELALGHIMEASQANIHALSLQQAIKNTVGVSAEVQVLAFDSLPRTVEGKVTRVIDKRLLA